MGDQKIWIGIWAPYTYIGTIGFRRPAHKKGFFILWYTLLHMKMHNRTVGICMWMSMCCLLRITARSNESPHCAHLCNFCPVWVIINWSCASSILLFHQMYSSLHCGFEQMPFKISSLTKLPIALDTGDILFSDMGCHVTIQISSLIKWLLAFWAKMHLFPTIWEQMPRHFTLVFGWSGKI